jgi:hypothetical protein
LAAEQDIGQFQSDHDERQLNSLISHCVGALHPPGIGIVSFHPLLTPGSLTTPLLIVGLGMRNDLTYPAGISNWHSLLRIFYFSFSRCIRVEWRIGIEIDVEIELGIGRGESRIRQFKKEEEVKERNILCGRHSC